MNPETPFLASAVKGFAWGALTFAILAGIGYMVTTNATPPVAIDDSARRLDLAQKELDRDNLVAVFEQTKIVLEKHPENSRALTLQAMVRAAMGEADRATEMLKRAAKNDPRNLDARVALAWVYAQNGRVADAEATIAIAVRDVPGEKALLDKVLAQIKAGAGAKKTS